MNELISSQLLHFKDDSINANKFYYVYVLKEKFPQFPSAEAVFSLHVLFGKVSSTAKGTHIVNRSSLDGKAINTQFNNLIAKKKKEGYKQSTCTAIGIPELLKGYTKEKEKEQVKKVSNAKLTKKLIPLQL